MPASVNFSTNSSSGGTAQIQFSAAGLATAVTSGGSGYTHRHLRR